LLGGRAEWVASAGAADRLAIEYWGNSVRAYLVAVSVLIAILLAVRIAKHILVTRTGLLVRRTASGLDDTILQVVDATRMWLTLFIALYAASMFLVLPPELAGKPR